MNAKKVTLNIKATLNLSTNRIKSVLPNNTFILNELSEKGYFYLNGITF